MRTTEITLKRGFLMVVRFLLFSNNPEYRTLARPQLEVRFINAPPYNVLVAARNAVHVGWRLLNHPLYGNFQPGHQPFRTLLLGATATNTLEFESLAYLEQALALYAKTTAMAAPENISQHMQSDCALLDKALLQETLNRYLYA